MSKKNRTLRQARAELAGGSPVVTLLREPADVIAMIPYVLGFTPAESVVVIALEGPRQRLGACVRLDLAESSDGAAAQASFLLEVIVGHRFDPVIIVAFSVDADRAGALVQPLRQGLARRNVGVTEALRADGRRWWSYACADPACCSPGGSSYDAASSRVAAEAVLSGLEKAPDRTSLRAQFEPTSAAAQQVVRDECDRLLRSLRAGELRPLDVAGLDRLVVEHLPEPERVPVADLTALLLGIQRISLRDAAWALINRANARRHFLLWRRVMQSAPDELMAPAGTLTGFAAWLDGRGAHAWHAVTRVELVSPGYSMCQLLRDLLEATVNPDVWSSFPLLRDPSPG